MKSTSFPVASCLTWAVAIRSAFKRGILNALGLGLAFFALLFPVANMVAAPGNVTFGNAPSCQVINGLTGEPVNQSEGVRAALYWAPPGSIHFAQSGLPVAVGVPLPGLFAGGTRNTGAATRGGEVAQFRVRAWGGGYDTYEQALQVPGVLVGESEIVLMATGAPDADPPMVPASLVAGGLGSLTLTANNGEPRILAGASNRIVECGSTVPFDTPATATACGDTNVTLTVLVTITNGAFPHVLTRTWIAFDACNCTNTGGQTVTMVDTTPPTLMCGAHKVVSGGEAWAFDPPAVSDGCCGDNVALTFLGTVTNGTCPQVIIRTWRATDVSGNSSSCSQIVTVVPPDCRVLVVTHTCPPYPVPPGGILNYTGTVTNRGDLTLTNVVVVSDQPASNTLVFGPLTLLPKTGAAFAASYTAPTRTSGAFATTLTAAGVTPQGLVFTDSTSLSCPVAEVVVPGDRNGDGLVSEEELSGVLSNYWAHTAWLQMTNALRRDEGLFEIGLTNASAWNFSVLVSTNLVDWMSLPGPARPVFQFTDPDGTNASTRFYRLRWP